MAILHCTLCYPTQPEDSNLSALNDIRTHFPDYILGLSDHTLGTIVPAASVLYGVQVIEKHYTFDKDPARQRRPLAVAGRGRDGPPGRRRSYA